MGKIKSAKRSRSGGSWLSPYNIDKALGYGSALYKGGKKAYKTYKKIASNRPGRKAGYKTKAKRIRYDRDVVADSGQHGNLTKEKRTVYIGRKKRIGIITGWSYTHSTPNIISAGEGYQGVGTTLNVCTRAQFIGPTSNTRSSLTTSSVLFYEQSPMYKVTGGGVVPTNQTPTEVSICVTKVNYTLRILSMENVAQEVFVLMCTPKRSTQYSPQDAWFNGMSSERVGVSALVQQNLTTNTTATAGTAFIPSDVRTFGEYPTRYKTFRDQWKIVSVRKMVLAAGDQKDLSYDLIYNKKVDKGFFDTTGGDLYLRGLTVVPMIIIRGGLVSITDGLFTEPTYAQTKCGFVSMAKYHFGLPRKQGQQAPYELQFLGTIATNSPHVETIINDVDVSAPVVQI